MDKGLSLRISAIEVNYFNTRKEVIITAASKDTTSEKIIFELSFNEEDTSLMKPHLIKWYIGNTKDFPITRRRANSNTNLMSKLIGVYINILPSKIDDEPYTIRHYCSYFVGKTYPPAKRTEMLTRQEIDYLIKGLIKKYPDIFSRDERFSAV